MVWEGHAVGISSEPCEEAAVTHSTCVVLWRKLIWSAWSADCSFSWPQKEAGKKPLDDIRCPDPAENLALSLECSLEFVKLFLFFSLPIRSAPTLAYSSKSSEHPLTPRQHLPLTPFQLHHPLFLFSVALQQAPDPQGALHLHYFTS